MALFGTQSRKERRQTVVSPPEFVRPKGRDYVEYLAEVHSTVVFDWYMEVGCRSGITFGPVRGKTIAVDPYFQVGINVIGQKPELHVFQATSDDFFASGFLQRSGIRLSFSFLDGMHLVEYLLRDFMNTERNSLPESVIAIHDCCPWSTEMATRDLGIISDLPGKGWTGDVWKIVPILQKYRPDLKLTMLDAHPTGLLLVSRLSPGNDILQRAYDEILADWIPKDLSGTEAHRFFRSFDYVGTQGFLDGPGGLWAPLNLPESAAMVPKPISL